MATLKEKADEILLEKQTKVRPENIVAGVQVFDVTGTAETLKLQGAVSVTPKTTQTVVTPEAGFNGMSKVTVEAVDRTIDANIIASNIKSGVTILNVTGNFEGDGGEGTANVYESVEELELEEKRAIGDKAIIAKAGSLPLGRNKSSNKLYFPQTVVLSGTFTGTWLTFEIEEGYYSNIMFKDTFGGLKREFSGTYEDKSGTEHSVSVVYGTKDYITYTRESCTPMSELEDGVIDFGDCHIYCDIDWKDWFDHAGYFIRYKTDIFEGAYTCVAKDISVPYFAEIPTAENLMTQTIDSVPVYSAEFMQRWKNYDTFYKSNFYAIIDEYEEDIIEGIATIRPTKYSFIRTTGGGTIALGKDGYVGLTLWSNNGSPNMILETYEDNLLIDSQTLTLTAVEGTTSGISTYNVCGKFLGRKYVASTTTITETLIGTEETVTLTWKREGILQLASWEKLNNATLVSADQLVKGYTAMNKNNELIEGTFEGVDSSSATATAADIVKGKTAYVKNAEVTGTMAIMPNNTLMAVTAVTDNTTESVLDMEVTNGEQRVVSANAKIKPRANYSDVAAAINLTGDKLLAGNTILGVVGTATSGEGLAGGAHLFASVEEMNASADVKEGEKSIVYNYVPTTYENIKSSSKFKKAYFPKTIILSSAPTALGYMHTYFKNADESKEFYFSGSYDDWDGDIMFDLMCHGCLTVSYSYNSTTMTITRGTMSGSTLASIDNTTGIVDFGEEFHFDAEYSDWSSFLGNIMKVPSESSAQDFIGIYMMNNGVQELAPTQFDAKPEYVYNGTFYTDTGVQTGTMLAQTDNTFIGGDHEIYAQLMKIYNSMEPVIADDTTKNPIGKNVKYIPTKLDGTSLLNTSLITNANGFFHYYEKLKTIDGMNFSNAINMSNFCSGCKELEYVKLGDLPKVTSISNIAHWMYNIKEIEIGDTPNLTSCTDMFRYAPNLCKIPNLNTSKVTNMCNFMYSLPLINNVPHYDTSNVKNFSNFMTSMSNLTSIPNFNVSNATNISQMLEGSYKLTNLPDWSFPNVTNAYQAFSNCSGLTSINLTNFSKLNYAYWMFAGCSNLKSIGDLGIGGNGKAVNVAGMFYSCSNLTDIPYYDIKPTDMDRFASGCRSLTNNSVINVIKMCLNSTQYSYKNLMTSNSRSPLAGTQFSNSYYQDYVEALTAAGWTC